MKDMRTEKIQDLAAALVRFSLPLIFSGILQQLYNWVDALIVGNVSGETALAAVGATTTIVNFYVMAITGFSTGLTILFSRCAGSGETKDISGILSTFLIFMTAVCAVTALGGVLLAGPILRMMQTTSDTFDFARAYLRIVLLGVPFLAVYNVYSAALRGLGNSRAPFYSVLLSSCINILLDLVLVAGMNLGTAGAAAATVVSQAAMTVYLAAYSVKRYPLLRFRLERRAFGREQFALGCRYGIPPMLQSSISSVGSLILQNFMNGFGTHTVAAITTAYRIDSIIMLPVINLGSAISTMVSQSCGAGDRLRAKRLLEVGVGLMIFISAALMAIVIPLGGTLIGLFGAGEEAAEIGSRFFRTIAGFYIIYGLSNAFRGYLEGMGELVYSSAASILALLVRIAASWMLVGIFGNMVIAWAEGLSWALMLILYAARTAMNLRKSERAALRPSGGKTFTKNQRLWLHKSTLQKNHSMLK